MDSAPDDARARLAVAVRAGLSWSGYAIEEVQDGAYRQIGRGHAFHRGDLHDRILPHRPRGFESGSRLDHIDDEHVDDFDDHDAAACCHYDDNDDDDDCAASCDHDDHDDS